MRTRSKTAEGKSAALVLSGRAVAILVALLIGASWLIVSSTRDAPSATSPLGPINLVEGSPEKEPTTALVSVEQEEPANSERAAALADRVPLVSPDLITSVAESEDTTQTEPVLAFSGRVNFYEDGQLSPLRLNGSAEFEAKGFPTTTVDVTTGQFQLMLHRQASGEYTLADHTFPADTDLKRLYFRFAAPQGQGMRPLLHYNVGTGAPQRYIESIPFGTSDVLLSVTSAPVLKLDVLDQKTGAHIDRACVVAVTDQGLKIKPRKGEGEMRLAWHEPSPLELALGEPLSHSTAVGLAVHVPGYGTAKITMDFTHPGDRVIALRPGGSLVVEIDGELPEGAKLTVYGQGGNNRTLPAEAGEISIDSLAPATYRARLHFTPDKNGAPVTFASGQVDVRPGETAQLTLSIPRQESILRADLAGTLVLPEAWCIQMMAIQG